jgi:hypothetical protein
MHEWMISKSETEVAARACGDGVLLVYLDDGWSWEHIAHDGVTKIKGEHVATRQGAMDHADEYMKDLLEDADQQGA